MISKQLEIVRQALISLESNTMMVSLGPLMNGKQQMVPKLLNKREREELLASALDALDQYSTIFEQYRTDWRDQLDRAHAEIQCLLPSANKSQKQSDE